MTGRRRAVAALMLWTAGLAGCPDARIPPPPDALTDVDAVLALADRHLEGLRSLAVEARTSYYADDRVLKGKTSILVRRPSAIHFSAMSPTDDLLAVFATDGDRFSSFERGGDVCHVGVTCPANVGRFTSLAMTPDDLATVLFGGAPRIRATSRRVAWDPRVGAYRVTLDGDGGTVQDIWIAHDTGLTLRSTLRRGGRIDLSVAWSDVHPVADHALPHTLDVEMSAGNVDLRIVYRDVDINLALADDAFRIPCPAGTKPVELLCPEESPP